MTPFRGYLHLLLVVCCLLYFTEAAKKKKYEKWCERSCGDYPIREICATNNQTFAKRCEMFHYSCSTGREIDIAYKGTCRVLTACERDRMQRLQAAAKEQLVLHVPDCYSRSGRYKPRQCTNSFCWCVNVVTGAYIPDTSGPETGFSFQCSPHGTQEDEEEEAEEEKKEGGKSECAGEEKRKFAASVFALIKLEHGAGAGPSANKSLTPVEARFLALDSDRDGEIRRGELTPFRRYVKRVIPEKQCAKLMAHHCDMDRSGRLSFNEWLMCVQPNDFLLDTLNTRPRHPLTSEGTGDIRGEDDISSVVGAAAAVGSSDQWQTPYLSTGDCFSRRQYQISAAIRPLAQCEADGSFTPMQCTRVEGSSVCWCVDRDTGLAVKLTTGEIAMHSDPAHLNCNNINKRHHTLAQQCQGEVEENFVKQTLANYRATLDPLSNANLAKAEALEAIFHSFDVSEPLSYLDRNELINFALQFAINPPAMTSGDLELTSDDLISDVRSDLMMTSDGVTSGDLEPTSGLLGDPQMTKLCADTMISRCDRTKDGTLSLYEWNACMNGGNPMLPIE